MIALVAFVLLIALIAVPGLSRMRGSRASAEPIVVAQVTNQKLPEKGPGPPGKLPDLTRGAYLIGEIVLSPTDLKTKLKGPNNIKWTPKEELTFSKLKNVELGRELPCGDLGVVAYSEGRMVGSSKADSLRDGACAYKIKLPANVWEGELKIDETSMLPLKQEFQLEKHPGAKLKLKNLETVKFNIKDPATYKTIDLAGGVPTINTKDPIKPGIDSWDITS